MPAQINCNVPPLRPIDLFIYYLCTHLSLSVTFIFQKSYGLDGDDYVEAESFFDQAIGTSMYAKAQAKAYHPVRPIKRQTGQIEYPDGATARDEDPYLEPQLPVKKSKSARTRVAPR